MLVKTNRGKLAYNDGIRAKTISVSLSLLILVLFASAIISRQEYFDILSVGGVILTSSVLLILGAFLSRYYFNTKNIIGQLCGSILVFVSFCFLITSISDKITMLPQLEALVFVWMVLFSYATVLTVYTLYTDKLFISSGTRALFVWFTAIVTTPLLFFIPELSIVTISLSLLSGVLYMIYTVSLIKGWDERPVKHGLRIFTVLLSFPIEISYEILLILSEK